MSSPTAFEIVMEINRRIARMEYQQKIPAETPDEEYALVQKKAELKDLKLWITDRMPSDVGNSL